MENVKSEKRGNSSDKTYFYRDQLITIEDLNDFKRQLLYEIKILIKECIGQSTKRWLKSSDVRKLLNISPGTLQNLRDNKTLPFTKIGGVIYFDHEDVQKMMQSKKNPTPTRL